MFEVRNRLRKASGKENIVRPSGMAFSIHWAKLGADLAYFFDTLVETHVGLGAVARVEEVADVVSDFLAHGDFGDVGLSVLLEMKLATLPRRSVESGFERGFKAFVGVGGNQIGNADASFA